MAVCVAGITVLQLYFTYQSYTVEERVFYRKVNEALNEAVDTAIVAHRESVVQQFKGWMADTTIVKISCSWDGKQRQTIFVLQDGTSVGSGGQVKMSMGHFGRADTITPGVKVKFINYMANEVQDMLKNGSIYFFTQRLGDSLEKRYQKTPISISILNKEYKKALQRRNINLPFSFTAKAGTAGYTTQKVNASPMRPSMVNWVQAGFPKTNMFLLQQLKWTIGGTVLLMVITLFCFGYTGWTLLSQQKLNALKDDFISNMTHEIHTPLTSITVTAQSLKQFSHDHEAQQSYLDIILYQSRKLAALTDEILTGAKLQKNGISLKDSVNINEVIIQAIKGSGTTIDCQLCPDDITIQGNTNHLVRAIGNLIDNAVKYGGEHAHITIKCTISNKQLHIEVADNGPGIPDAFKQKVFEQFFRMPSGNIHNIKGYGLGLSYVKKVILAHKGIITVADNVPAGAIFKIILPL